MTTQTFEAQVINAQAINDDELEQVQGGFAPLLPVAAWLPLAGGTTVGIAKALTET